nr:MAG TPA: hypothetical protein [Caudoviricetes sp.]
MLEIRREFGGEKRRSLVSFPWRCGEFLALSLEESPRHSSSICPMPDW